MIDGHKIVVVTPAGRRRYLEILRRHVLACGVVDQWSLWANTANADDLRWMDDAAAADPRIEVKRPWWPADGTFPIHRYFAGCVEPKTAYIRLDDDIVWTAPDAIERLARVRLENPTPFIVIGNIVNNALTSFVNQETGRLTYKHGIAKYSCMDPIGWGNGEFAVDLHREFLKKPEMIPWLCGDWTLDIYERCSINAIAWTGEEAAEWAPRIGWEEEVYLSETFPKAANRPNMIVGDAVFVHYAFHPQRPIVDAAPDILAGYRKLAGLE